jgi:hypothetical protein
MMILSQRKLKLASEVRGRRERHEEVRQRVRQGTILQISVPAESFSGNFLP